MPFWRGKFREHKHAVESGLCRMNEAPCVLPNYKDASIALRCGENRLRWLKKTMKSPRLTAAQDLDRSADIAFATKQVDDARRRCDALFAGSKQGRKEEEMRSPSAFEVKWESFMQACRDRGHRPIRWTTSVWLLVGDVKSSLRFNPAVAVSGRTQRGFIVILCEECLRVWPNGMGTNGVLLKDLPCSRRWFTAHNARCVEAKLAWIRQVLKQCEPVRGKNNWTRPTKRAALHSRHLSDLRVGVNYLAMIASRMRKTLDESGEKRTQEQ